MLVEMSAEENKERGRISIEELERNMENECNYRIVKGILEKVGEDRKQDFLFLIREFDPLNRRIEFRTEQCVEGFIESLNITRDQIRRIRKILESDAQEFFKAIRRAQNEIESEEV